MQVNKTECHSCYDHKTAKRCVEEYFKYPKINVFEKIHDIKNDLHSHKLGVFGQLEMLCKILSELAVAKPLLKLTYIDALLTQYFNEWPNIDFENLEQMTYIVPTERVVLAHALKTLEEVDQDTVRLLYYRIPAYIRKELISKVTVTQENCVMEEVQLKKIINIGVYGRMGSRYEYAIERYFSVERDKPDLVETFGIDAYPETPLVLYIKSRLNELKIIEYYLKVNSIMDVNAQFRKYVSCHRPADPNHILAQNYIFPNEQRVFTKVLQLLKNNNNNNNNNKLVDDLYEMIPEYERDELDKQFMSKFEINAETNIQQHGELKELWRLVSNEFSNALNSDLPKEDKDYLLKLYNLIPGDIQHITPAEAIAYRNYCESNSDETELAKKYRVIKLGLNDIFMRVARLVKEPSPEKIVDKHLHSNMLNKLRHNRSFFESDQISNLSERILKEFIHYIQFGRRTDYIDYFHCIRAVCAVEAKRSIAKEEATFFVNELLDKPNGVVSGELVYDIAKFIVDNGVNDELTEELSKHLTTKNLGSKLFIWNDLDAKVKQFKDTTDNHFHLLSNADQLKSLERLRKIVSQFGEYNGN